MNPQELIDSIEQDIQRMRIDEALKASLVARLDENSGGSNERRNSGIPLARHMASRHGPSMFRVGRMV